MRRVQHRVLNRCSVIMIEQPQNAAGFRAGRCISTRAVENFNQAHRRCRNIAATKLQLDGEHAGNVIVRINPADPLERLRGGFKLSSRQLVAFPSGSMTDRWPRQWPAMPEGSA